MPETSLTPARATLLAAHLAAIPDIKRLRSLIRLHHNQISATIILRVLLLFVPETTDPADYTPLVRELCDGVFTTADDDDGNDEDTDAIDATAVEKINEPSAVQTLQNINIDVNIHSLSNTDTAATESNDTMPHPLSNWLISRARRIDEQTGLLGLADALLLPFIENDPSVYAWYTGILRVLTKLVYRDAGDGAEIGGSGSVAGRLERDGYGLSWFEALEGDSAVRVLLKDTRADMVAGDFEEMVVPYVRFRRKEAWTATGEGVQDKRDPWEWVWGWMCETAAASAEGFAVVVGLIEDWDGPDDESTGRDGYAKAALAACYLCEETGAESTEGMHSIIGRVAEMRQLPIEEAGPFDGLVESVRGAGTGNGSDDQQGQRRRRRRDDVFARETLTDAGCELTNPTALSLGLLDLLVRSMEIINPHLPLVPMSGMANTRLQGSKEEQSGLLLGLIRSGNWTSRGEGEWKNMREGVLWLQSESRVLGELSLEYMETELLKGMLSATCFRLVSEIYITGKRARGPLPNEVVESKILHAVIHEFYDNASNGNRTRGSMKNAYNALQIIYPSHSQSLPLAKASRLISATHALSNYSLTLTPGVPLKPVQIRIHPDPPSLISRVLQSNAKSYTQVDSLLSIARDLVDGVSSPDIPLKDSSDPGLDARITGMCVEAALGEDDFETAYSLIMTRLIGRHRHQQAQEPSQPPQSLSASAASAASEKDVAWQSCLQAGRYRPPQALEHGFRNIRQLEMRMDLLSRALLICPAAAMGEVLSLWRRCEDELIGLLDQEAVEEDKHAKLGLPSAGGSIFPSGLAGYASFGGGGGGGTEGNASASGGENWQGQGKGRCRCSRLQRELPELRRRWGRRRFRFEVR